MERNKHTVRKLILLGIGILAAGLHCRTEAPSEAPSSSFEAAQELKEEDNEMQQKLERLLANKAEKRRKPNAASNNNHDEKPSKVVLIVVDTQRADSLQPYGESHPTTPFVSMLAKEGITFKNAFSTSSWTAPAMFSIMTGLYPSEHGVIEGTTLGFVGRKKIRAQPVLPKEAITLAEVLKDSGYTTYGINTNFLLKPKFGFDQGFDQFFGRGFTFLPYANMIVDGLAEEYKRTPRSFLWLHYFDPHYPYRPMPPWFGRWNDTKYKTYLDFAIGIGRDYLRQKENLGPDQFFDAKYVTPIIEKAKKTVVSQAMVSQGLQHLDNDPGSEYVRFLKAAYLSEVRTIDDAMSQALASLGVDDQTMIIVTADHGEELFDHGWCGHRHTLYQELTHVPLIIRLPGKERAGTVIHAPVSLVDVFPTVLDLLDLSMPKGLSGVSLKPLIEGKTVSKRPLYIEVDNRRVQLRALVEYPWKYIYNLTEKTGELFNLKRDPGEKNDLAKQNAGRGKTMRRRLLRLTEQIKPRWVSQGTESLTPNEIKQLKKMGYLQ